MLRIMNRFAASGTPISRFRRQTSSPEALVKSNMRADAIGDAFMTEHKINPGLIYLNIGPTAT